MKSFFNVNVSLRLYYVINKKLYLNSNSVVNIWFTIVEQQNSAKVKNITENWPNTYRPDTLPKK